MNKNREFLVKFDDKISDKFGQFPEDRSFEELLNKGFIVLDKDIGPTSHQEVDYLKKVLNIKKAGHSGTLDPKVSGVLVCGLGHATRLMEYMLKSNKEYICLMYVHKPISDDLLKKGIEKFIGEIIQTPPIVSAVRRRPRPRTVYDIEVLDTDSNNQNVLMKISCQHGTYMRKICSDMGDFFGCNAHMKELRRIKAGAFSEEDNLISLDKLRSLYELYLEEKDEGRVGVDNVFEMELRKYIQPMENLLRDFKHVIVRDSAVSNLCHGADLAIPGVLKIESGIEIGEEVAIFTAKGELVGMGMAFLSSDDVIKKKKGAFVKTNKIFLGLDVYPKSWIFKKN